MTDDPRHPPEIWAHRYSNGVVGARDRSEPYSSLSHGDPFVQYVRADLGSFYQEKDIDALEARIAELSRAGNTLAVYAVTTGGIAGRDEGLQQAIDQWCAVLRKDRDGEE